MIEKTFRDELAMSFDTKGYSFGSLHALFDFVGHEYSTDDEKLKLASVASEAKLRYMYADAMLKEANNV